MSVPFKRVIDGKEVIFNNGGCVIDGYQFHIYSWAIIFNPDELPMLDDPGYMAAFSFLCQHNEVIQNTSTYDYHGHYHGDPPGGKKKEKSIREPKPGYVYLIRAVEPQSHYKIGYSSTPKSRIDTLEVKLPFPLEPICVIETHDMFGLERELHDLFWHCRVNGEWFRLTAADVEYIKALAVPS